MSDIEVVLSKSNIPKLDDLNYTSWSSLIRAYLQSKDLYKVVTGEVNPANKKLHETANILIKVNELTASVLLVSSDLSESSESDQSSGEPDYVADQPTVAAAAHNLINLDAWIPTATGPLQPVSPEFRLLPELRNLKPPQKRKPPARRSSRMCVTQSKNPKNIQKSNKKTKKMVPSPFPSSNFF
ncbi:hypothetical protein PCASD_01242 [Puccinia coronata f. sp. avenae]|uniref:DUF4219 domain-containing protein n=1 Tax=Puccinia coronata f. sp. avenae TaxID=200324 RepID=A0A2N5T0B5_9BASI|nr:hypothetical protein PCASD_22743 [Puccinia coronata f. sp. avenae]PLW50020.1 hypothetical protein PCASD_01242 [Puccinia coronata f. sp. avenae]